MKRPYELKGPKRIQIQPTDRCNLVCKFCERRDYFSPESELDSKSWERIIDDIVELAPEKMILVGGGEPLLRKDVFNLAIEKLSEADIYTSLVTSGTLFDESDIERMIENEWNHIVFSIHAPFAKLADELYGVEGAFERTLRNIELIKEKKEEYDNKLPTMAITTVLNKSNYRYLEELKEFVKEYELEPLTLRIMSGDPDSCDFIPKADLVDVKNKLYKISGEIHTRYEFNMSELTGYYDSETVDRGMDTIPYCLSPFFEMAVFADGTVTPCCFMFGDAAVSTDADSSSLCEIWSGDFFEELRQRSILGDKSGLCKECQVSRMEMSDLRKDFEKYYNELLDQHTKDVFRKEFMRSKS